MLLSRSRLLINFAWLSLVLAGRSAAALSPPPRFDVIAVHQSGTSSATTEINILDGATTYQEFCLLNRPTPVPQTDHSWEFAAADWNADGVPDLVAVSKKNTGSHMTEVHILTGLNANLGFPFAYFLAQVPTALPETEDDWAFTMADWDKDGIPDLIGVKKVGTGTNSTELHILSGASLFQNFILQTGTALPESTPGPGRRLSRFWDFALLDWNHDGIPDLIAVSKDVIDGTRIQILSGASGFSSFLLDTYTPIGPAGLDTECGLADVDGDGWLDLVCIKRRLTGTGTTEVHVLTGARNFQEFILETGTPLPETDSSWQFVIAPWGRSTDVAKIFSFAGQATANIELFPSDLVTRDFTIHARFSMDRRLASLTSFPNLGSNGFKVTKAGGGAGTFNPDTGSFAIPLTIRYSTTLPFVGAVNSDVDVVLTTGTVTSPRNVYTLTGSPLTPPDILGRSGVVLVGVGTFKGGIFDGQDYKIRIPANLFPADYLFKWLPGP